MPSHVLDLASYSLPYCIDNLTCQSTRRVLAYWNHRVSLAYPDTAVDWQIGMEAYLLCEATEAYLYSRFTPLEILYRPGSRPELEAILTDTIRIDRCQTDQDKAVAIMRFARDIWLEREGADLMNAAFHGGTEEEIIAKQSKLCNELARVLIVLAQIAGLPARYIGHIPGDHGTTEVYVDGAWAYFDVRGHHYEKPDGRLASFAELRRNPQWIETQGDRLTAELAEGYSLDSTREFVGPGCQTFIANYFVWDADRYGYQHIENTPELFATIAATNEPWAKLKKEHYGNF